jgi:hypothetical protein
MNTDRFVVCLSNEGYEASLEKGKIYLLLDAQPNDPSGWVRVIDESGEDYLFSSTRFFEIALPAEVANALKPAAA